MQPRVGFAYQLNDKTVVRGGWAIYAVPALFDISGIYQPGFSQGTGIVPSLDTGVTVRATLSNPWPDGVATPPGASNGPNTFLGRTIGRFNDDLDYVSGQSMRWVNERPARAAGAVRRRGRLRRVAQLRSDDRLQSQPGAARSTCRRATSATRPRSISSTATVPNPFAGLLPGETLNGTAQRQQLLRPFPQFQRHRRPPLRRVEPLRFGAGPAAPAVRRRLHVRDQLHLVELQGEGHPPERDRSRLRGAVQRHAPAAPPGRERHLGAAVRPRPQVGKRRQRDRQRADRQLERLGGVELAVGPARTWPWATSTTTATSPS